MIGAAPGWAADPLHAPLPRRAAAPQEPVRMPARVARLLVLAHQLRQRIDDGSWANASEAAAELGISRNRMSQVLMLTFLAPDIQVQVLALEAVDGVEPAITEKWLFAKVARLVEWKAQRDVWAVSPHARALASFRCALLASRDRGKAGDLRSVDVGRVGGSGRHQQERRVP